MTDSSNALTRGVARALRSRRMMRAPIWVYRAKLGFLFGSRLLMLEHIGRKTGATRQVVLEVIGHPDPDTYIVVSGFGDRAQWFRNLQANPHVRVSSGGRRSAKAVARVLTQKEADDALQSYIAKHREAWERLKPTLEETLGAPITEQDTPLPMVGLHLESAGGPR